MNLNDSPHKPAAATVPEYGCEEHKHLLEDFGAAIRELLDIHEQQWSAIIVGDDDSCRFDLLIHMANEKKQQAKYAYLRHVESHGCSEYNVLDQTRTRSAYR
jgi:hypothetical protein